MVDGCLAYPSNGGIDSPDSRLLKSRFLSSCFAVLIDCVVKVRKNCIFVMKEEKIMFLSAELGRKKSTFASITYKDLKFRNQ